MALRHAITFRRSGVVVTSGSYKVRMMTSADEADYTQFASRVAPSNVYGSLAFRDFLAKIVPGRASYFLAYGGDGTLVGALPMFECQEEGLGLVVNSLPWFGSHGACLLEDKSAWKVRHALVSALRTHLHANRGLSANIVLTPAEDVYVDQYVEASGGTVCDTRIGQVTILPDAGPELQKRLEAHLRQKTRNLCRKALRQGFSEWQGDDDWAWEFLYHTHRENIEALGGRCKPREHFDALRSGFDGRNRRLSVALDDGQPVAALLLLLWEGTVEYLTPGVRVECRSRQPLSFLIWRAMLELAGRGFRNWNWGGTWASQQTLHHFKAGWGAEDRPYSYVLLTCPGVIEKLRPWRKRIRDLYPFYYLLPYQWLPDGDD